MAALSILSTVKRLASHAVYDGSGLLILAVLLIPAVWPLFGRFVAAAAITGMVVGAVLHLWYGRHPVTGPVPRPKLPRSPEINFSATPVAGDLGGLLFAVGSVVLLLVGLPGLRWFIAASMACAAAAAVVAILWRRSHPAPIADHVFEPLRG